MGERLYIRDLEKGNSVKVSISNGLESREIQGKFYKIDSEKLILVTMDKNSIILLSIDFGDIKDISRTKITIQISELMNDYINYLDSRNENKPKNKEEILSKFNVTKETINGKKKYTTYLRGDTDRAYEDMPKLEKYEVDCLKKFNNYYYYKLVLDYRSGVILIEKEFNVRGFEQNTILGQTSNKIWKDLTTEEGVKSYIKKAVYSIEDKYNKDLLERELENYIKFDLSFLD